jgi:hypothetical protein
MKPHSVASLWLTLTLLASACTKNDVLKPQDQPAFPAHTEWAGIIHLAGWDYDRPCCLRIYEDSTVMLYALFTFGEGEDRITKDSLAGRIIQTTHGGHMIRLTINFPDLPPAHANATVLIQDRRALEYKSNTGDFAMHLKRFPVEGTLIQGDWTGPTMQRGSAKSVYAYPDLSSIQFSADGTTVYRRNNRSVQIQNTATGELTILRAPYTQDGATVWMSGYNEEKHTMVPYFGVLMPDGQGMWIDSRSTIEGRLPGPAATDQYGPKGVTPAIYNTNQAQWPRGNPKAAHPNVQTPEKPHAAD